MAVNLHRISTGISSGRSRKGFGNIVSFPSVPAGFPAFGTVLSTAYGVTYEQGAIPYVAYSTFLALNVDTYDCDVNTIADGVGGSFIDWANAVNISPKPNGTFIATGIDDFPDGAVLVANNYYNSGYYTDTNEVHDGAGSIDTVGAGTFVYYPNLTVITGAYNQDNTTEVPNGSSNWYQNGTYIAYNYVWDGNGSFYQDGGTNTGSYYPAGTEVSTSLRYNTVQLETEVPSGSSSYHPNGKTNFDSYFWDGNGGANSGNLTEGSFYPHGTYIYYDNNLASDHYWNGLGGYYSESTP